jgi:tetratricopeptide (TPR) repeat protein
MRQVLLCRAPGAAVFFALTLAGCAGSQGSSESAKTACERALHSLATPDGCDAYVAAALQSKDKDEIFDAYTYRALLREFREDLPGALADADQAIAAKPGEAFGHRRRASIVGESGEYKQALQSFVAVAPINPTHGFDENLAMLEYVTGNRAGSILLFQSAAADYAENDRDPNMAAVLRFNGAIIESELRGGDLAPIAALDVSARTDTMLPLLKQHRLGEMSDADLIARVEKMTGSAAKENVCDGYFSVGHRNAVAGNAAAARQALQVAVERCSVVTFEHHAAKAWLKQLGA